MTLVHVTDDESRDERRHAMREATEQLKASGALDELFARIDAGEVELAGRDGLIQQLIKAGLERGLQAELTDHLGYERGDPTASLFANSRNGSFPKTVASQVGDVDLDIPRDRLGSFTPTLVPKGARRLSGLDDMIISLYAGGMTLRDIEYHLASTIGTEISRETLSKIVDEVVAANKKYASGFGTKKDLALPPARGFAILTCMDARLDPAKYAGLAEGDAHVIRNAGGRATDDAIRSLVISHKLLGTR